MPYVLIGKRQRFKRFITHVHRTHKNMNWRYLQVSLAYSDQKLYEPRKWLSQFDFRSLILYNLLKFIRLCHTLDSTLAAMNRNSSKRLRSKTKQINTATANSQRRSSRLHLKRFQWYWNKVLLVLIISHLFPHLTWTTDTMHIFSYSSQLISPPAQFHINKFEKHSLAFTIELIA